MKIASLLPSSTEIVYALGLGDQLVGVTFECDYPPQARADAAVVVGGLHTTGMTPGEIDALVLGRIAAGDDLYHLDDELIRAAAPDVILTQDLCRVCALPAGDVDAALASIGCESHVITLDPHTLDDVLASIVTIGEATGAAATAAELVDSLRARLARVSERVAGEPMPSVFVLEWIEPPYVSGHWVPDLITAAGGRPVLCEPGARSHPTTWDEIGLTDAELVIVAPCGFDAAAAADQANAIRHLLPAGVPVWAVDGNAYVVRPGPRLVDGVELIAEILHPTGATIPATSAIRI